MASSFCLAEYRVARHLAPLLRRTPDFFTVGLGFERIETTYTVGAFRPRGNNPRYPDGIVSRRVVDQEPRLGFRLWGPLPSQQTRTFGFQTIVPMEYEGYRRTIGAGHLVRAGAKNVPLFVLDVAFNGYFQYRSEAHLPEDLRRWRAAAGGTGNAIISSIVTAIGGLVIAKTCVATAGLCVIGIGALTLTVDFTANLAFDKWAKEPLLERIGLGRKPDEE